MSEQRLPCLCKTRHLNTRVFWVFTFQVILYYYKDNLLFAKLKAN